MNIEFFNYNERFTSMEKVLPELIQSHCETGEFILKRTVTKFEKALQDYIDKDSYCLGVSSASTGMILALKSLGIGKGDEVITPAYSYVSTVSSIISVGATPVFVDVSLSNFMAATEEIINKVSNNTKAVIAVHLYSSLMNIKDLRNKLPTKISILEDSATCLGGKFNDGTPTGLHGDIGVYSLFPAKPLGSLGDAGIIITKNKKLHRICKMLRNHGQDEHTRFMHFTLGYNSRMDDINAAFLLRKLNNLDEQNDRRREIAARYDLALRRNSKLKNQENSYNDRVPYSYVVLYQNPEKFIAFLAKRGIQAKRGFPGALTRQPAFTYLVENPNQYPVADKIANSAVALPIYPELTNAQVDFVICYVMELMEITR